MAQKPCILATMMLMTLLNMTPSHAAQSLIQIASNDAHPTSADDISGNVHSFLSHVGEGVTIRKPYDPYNVVSRGIIPGHGAGYCLKGKPMPHINSAPNQVNLALIPCSTLESTGQFQRVATAATDSTGTSIQGGGNGKAAAIDPSQYCTQHQIPVDDGTGDQWCMRKNAMVIGRVHYIMKNSNYVPVFTRFEKEVSVGILQEGGRVDAKGNVVLPANVQAGWDKLDADKAAGLAKIQADDTAHKAQMERNNQARRAAFKSKLGLD
jgi:hypothetical protein